MKLIEYISYLMMPLMIIGIIGYGIYKKQKIYEEFVEGVNNGLKIVIRIFPTMLAMIVALNLFRESKAMDMTIKIISPLSYIIGIPREVLPLGFMRIMSGGASLGFLTDTINTYGVDSLVGNIACTILGASETTLYVLSLYSSSVNIKNTKYTLYIALACDLIVLFVATWIWKICVV